MLLSCKAQDLRGIRSFFKSSSQPLRLGLEIMALVGELLSSSPQNRAASLASTWPLTSSSLFLQIFYLFILAVLLTLPTECFFIEGWLGLRTIYLTSCPLLGPPKSLQVELGSYIKATV